MKNLNWFLISFLLCFLSMGCKPSIPSKYLQPDEIADILYDYHISEGIVNAVESGDSLALRSFKLNILSKYEVSEADFDSSMVYYVRHTKLLEDVYQKLDERLSAEANEQGSSFARLDASLMVGDTANIWTHSPSFALSPYVVTNRFYFEEAVDSSYHAGDRFMLDFDAQYIFQDGMRDAQAVLVVTYDNDSIEYVTNQISGSSHYHMQINNDGGLKIKSLKGFWIMNSGASSDLTSVSTLKLLIISNVKFIRLHVAANTGNNPTNNADTTGVAIADSLRRKK